MIIASFYTPDYAEDADRLRRSCERFGYQHWIRPCGESGSWERNCAQKGPFVHRTLEENPRCGVLWLDADSEIVSPLEFAPAVDFSVFRRTGTSDPDGDRFAFRSGTIWFGPSIEARAIAALWAVKCRQDPEEWDQTHLFWAWEYLNETITIETRWLSIDYCVRVNEPGYSGIARVVHYQRSRETRSKGR